MSKLIKVFVTEKGASINGVKWSKGQEIEIYEATAQILEAQGRVSMKLVEEIAESEPKQKSKSK